MTVTFSELLVTAHSVQRAYAKKDPNELEAALENLKALDLRDVQIPIQIGYRSEMPPASIRRTRHSEQYAPPPPPPRETAEPTCPPLPGEIAECMGCEACNKCRGGDR